LAFDADGDDDRAAAGGLFHRLNAVRGRRHCADAAFHFAAVRVDWLAVHAWVPGAAILATAGVYQLAPLKNRCLDQCRSPIMFIAMQLHGSRERRSSFVIGFPQ
jgi:predicted metal-binding membrane protein